MVSGYKARNIDRVNISILAGRRESEISSAD